MARFKSLFLCLCVWIVCLVTNGSATCTTTPQSFSAMAVNMTSLTISWTPVAGGTAPIAYSFSSSIDSSAAHPTTATSYTYTMLPVGTVYDVTARVETTCGGVPANPLTNAFRTNTVPDTPVVSKNMDDDTTINLVFTHSGSADSYRVASSIFSGSTNQPNLLVEGMKKGETYDFQVYIVLNSVESDPPGTYSHTVPDDKIAGLDPWTFAIIMIVVIIIIVIIIVIVIIVLFMYLTKWRHEKKGGKMSREGTGADGTDGQAWDYRDPYEGAQYNVTDAQRKRALAIAVQTANMPNNDPPPPAKKV